MGNETICSMRYDELRQVLRTHFQQLLEQKRDSINAQGRLSDLDKQAFRNGVDIAQDALQTGGPLNFIESDDDLLNRFMVRYGLDFDKGSERYRWLAEELKRAYRDHAKAVLDYDSSLDSYDFTLTKEHDVHRLGVVPEVAGMTIAQLAESYSQEKLLGGNWASKTEMEKADHIALLKEILGKDTDIQSLTAIEAKRVKDTLGKYPKNRSKNKMTRGKELSAVLEMPDVDVISVTTINKYLQSYHDLFEWAKRNGHTKDNLFSGLTIRQGKKRGQSEKREPFTRDQISLILQEISDKGSDLIKKDYQRWGTLIGIYTGARLNEIAQIHLDDIRKEGEVWCFDLNEEGGDKQLKTAAARRLVPIHQKLIELGLLRHVDMMRERGERKLFPDFTYSPQNGWGRTLGRWFNEVFLPKLDIKSKTLVFHSFRHTVVTRLMQAGVADPIVKALVGHQQQGVTHQHYFRQGYTIEQLNDALEKLDFSHGG
ncbi:site-specific integrase [Labrys sp. KNU-23]|uniref:site-specific integrase n=1 Tax=Labrys sp. KNU-23 TaxID=2789216 RepID=UPI00165A7E28|nr:site-specific integrase [Labrys sp. KNU-23]